jgi:hypothetical protein
VWSLLSPQSLCACVSPSLECFFLRYVSPPHVFALMSLQRGSHWHLPFTLLILYLAVCFLFLFHSSSHDFYALCILLLIRHFMFPRADILSISTKTFACFFSDVSKSHVEQWCIVSKYSLDIWLKEQLEAVLGKVYVDILAVI